MSRRFIRLMALVAAMALSTALLAACGGDDEERGGGSGGAAAAAGDTALKKGTAVRLWIMNNGPDPVKDTERLVQPFEQKTGVDVKVELVGWDVQFDRIRNAAVSGEGPDITQAGTTQVPFFAALGGFEDLSDRVSDLGGSEAYPEGVWSTTQVQGQEGTWATPWFTEARAIYYRKDVLKQAGIDPKTAFADWDAFRTTLETIKQKVPEVGGKPIQPFGTPGKKAFDLVHHVMPFVWDAGGAELNDDASKATIASPQAQQGVKYFADLVGDGLADKAQLERDGTQVENQFKAGRLAVWMGGPWVLQSSEREDDDKWTKAARENVGIAPMPAGPSGKGFTFVGGSNLMMLKSSKHKNEAWALLKYLSEPKVQTEYAALMGMFPSKADAQAQAGEGDENKAQFLKAIQQGRSYAEIPQWGQIENAYKGRFGEILDQAARGGIDDATLSTELRKAQDEADALLAQNAG
ncbi:MAG TPA: extracellular solute-binding protein [Solirubrobacteraceae bacterium]|nr:extracellular solute-binding protein [Solirubrobacteraceae bacterium]